MTICICCEKEFQPDKYHPHQKYCSRQCRQKHYFRTRGMELYHSRRKKAIEILGNKCILCGINDYMVLTIDHINDDPENDPFRVKPRRIQTKAKELVKWIIDNPEESHKRLQILCWNCNSLKRWHREEYNSRKT